MPKKHLTSLEKNVKELLLKGSSIYKTVRVLGISKNKAYSVVDKLISYGEIEELFKDDKGLEPFNPRLFVDPSDYAIVLSKDKTKMRAEAQEYLIGNRASGNQAPIWNSVGISTEKKCPEGYIGGHIKGDIEFEIEQVGDFKDFKGPDGTYFGYFEKNPKKNGRYGQQLAGEMRLFGQEIHLKYRWFDSTGKKMLILYPGRLFFDIEYFPDKEAVREAFIDRANYVAHCMNLNGWILKNPEIHGTLHYPFNMPGLAQHFDPRYQDDSADLIVDNSLGDPEVELTNEHDPLFHEKAELLSRLPSVLLDLLKRVSRLEKEIQGLKSQEAEDRKSTQDLTTLCLEQKEITEGLLDIVRSLSSARSEMIGLQSDMAVSILAIDKFILQQSCLNSQFIELHSQATEFMKGHIEGRSDEDKEADPDTDAPVSDSGGSVGYQRRGIPSDGGEA